MSKTGADWIRILTKLGVKASTAAKWGDAFAAEVRADKFSLGDKEIPDFVAQVLHESGMLEVMEEGLSYSRAARLCEVWPKRFPTEASAAPYVRNPQALANKVYGGRLGNTGPNDGWLCRGSGLIQVTGLENLKVLARIMGYDDPYKLAQDMRTNMMVALRASVLWWEGHVPDAVMGNVTRVRRAVNGGTIGLDDAARLYVAAKKELA